MHAIILAGGLGTRLRPALADVPKPMALVHGRPFLEYLLLQLRRAGYSQVVLCVGYRAEAIEAHFGDGHTLGMELCYSLEPEPLGTGGALKLAEGLLVGDSWLVLNGDSFFGIGLSELIDAHRASAAVATLALRREPEAGRYGSVVLEDQRQHQPVRGKDPIARAEARGAEHRHQCRHLRVQPTVAVAHRTDRIGRSSAMFPALAGKGAERSSLRRAVHRHRAARRLRQVAARLALVIRRSGR